MFKGTYCDQLYDSHGHPIFNSNWATNTIVEAVWPLIAGLLKDQPKLAGIRFLAFGAGDPAWDGQHVPADPNTNHLYNETHRLKLDKNQLVCLDEAGAVSANPTKRIEIKTELTNPGQDMQLREFGLFGGNATKKKNSGYMINYVIHPRINLTAGKTLKRRLRLSLRPDKIDDWQKTPPHWLGNSTIEQLDGIGSAYTEILGNAGIKTLQALADIEPRTPIANLPFMKIVELQAKARLALRTVTEISPVSGLLDRTAREIIVSPTATLATDAGISKATIQRLQEQMSILQLTLDNQFLESVTIGKLTQPL